MTKWEQRLAEAGFRLTASRRAVMQVLTQAEAPLSPLEIFQRGEVIHPNLGLVTVYRTLDLLSELDLVRRVHHRDGCHGYMPASPGHCHALICRDCGRAVEFPGDENLHPLIARIEAGTGFRVDEHLLQLLGLCPDCQETRA